MKALLPHNILKCMAPEDRSPLGKAGLTTTEISDRNLRHRERELQDRCLALCRFRGIAVGRSRMDRKTTYTLGWPDFTLCIHGRAVFVEFKVGDNQLDPDQITIRDSLIAPPNQATYHVCRSESEFINILNQYETSKA